MTQGPAKHNIIVKRSAAEGGVSDVGDMGQAMQGFAWRSPNFRQPDDVGGGADFWDIVDFGTLLQYEGIKWVGYLGLTINPHNTGSNDKSELSIFFRYGAHGPWGAVLEWRKWYLVAIEANNGREEGRRLDEFMKKSLTLAGLDYGKEFDRRNFYRGFDRIVGHGSFVFRTPSLRHQLVDSIAMMLGKDKTRKSAEGIPLVDSKGRGLMDKGRLMTRDGKDAGEYHESITGAIGGDMTTAEKA